ncbi:MAG: glycosyltransferase family 4 protein [Fimbriimonas sp.]
MTKRSFDVEHVLMTTDAVGGVWTYCLDLAQGLARHGVRVTLATLGPEPSARQCEEARQIPGLELYTSNYRLEWMHQPWSDVDAAGDWLLALAERIRPDVIHLNEYAHAALPWPAPTLVACHGDVLSWWQAVKGGHAPMDEWSEYARRVREGLGAAGLVVAPTAAVLADVERYYGVQGAARVIYNGRSSAEYPSVAKRSMVFTAGRFWDEAKNISALQAAAPKLDWPVYVAGEVGEQRPRGGDLNFLGRLCPSAMGSWLGRAGIFALPAKYEPAGFSVLEAALAKCALVLGDIPSLRELWDGAAIFVDPSDSKALETAIQGLIRDETLRKEMAVRAYARAQEYSVAAMACGTLFAYQDLVQTNLLDLAVFTHPGVSLR